MWMHIGRGPKDRDMVLFEQTLCLEAETGYQRWVSEGINGGLMAKNASYELGSLCIKSQHARHCDLISYQATCPTYPQ